MTDEGNYCKICGGLVTGSNDTKQIEIDGKLVGISCLDEIICEVRKLNLDSELKIKEELVSRVSKKNYIPSKKKEAYEKALLEVYLNS